MTCQRDGKGLFQKLRCLIPWRTLERCEILMISGDAIRQNMAEDAAFGVAIARELSGCYRSLVRTIKNQKVSHYKPVKKIKLG